MEESVHIRRNEVTDKNKIRLISGMHQSLISSSHNTRSLPESNTESYKKIYNLPLEVNSGQSEHRMSKLGSALHGFRLVSAATYTAFCFSAKAFILHLTRDLTCSIIILM